MDARSPLSAPHFPVAGDSRGSASPALQRTFTAQAGDLQVDRRREARLAPTDDRGPRVLARLPKVDRPLDVAPADQDFVPIIAESDVALPTSRRNKVRQRLAAALLLGGGLIIVLLAITSSILSHRGVRDPNVPGWQPPRPAPDADVAPSWSPASTSNVTQVAPPTVVTPSNPSATLPPVHAPNFELPPGIDTSAVLQGVSTAPPTADPRVQVIAPPQMRTAGLEQPGMPPYRGAAEAFSDNPSPYAPASVSAEPNYGASLNQSLSLAPSAAVTPDAAANAAATCPPPSYPTTGYPSINYPAPTYESTDGRHSGVQVSPPLDTATEPGVARLQGTIQPPTFRTTNDFAR